MSKTAFSDTPPLGTLVTAAFLNAIQNHRHSGADADGAAPLDYVVSTGSANAYILTLSPALTAHVPGMPIRFKANFANSGAATVNINGLGDVPLKKAVTAALKANDILSGQIITICHDGTNYQIQAGISVDDYSSSLVANGWAVMPDGRIEQWGIDTTSLGETTRTISFNIAFPNAVLNLSLSGLNPSANTFLDCFPQEVSKSLSSFTYISQNVGGGTSNAGISWRAIGK